MAPKIIIIAILCSLTLSCFAQKDISKLLPQKGKTITSFIPKGWIKLDSASGDFDRNGIKDIAIVIVDSMQEKMTGEVNRTVVILRGTTGGFSLSGLGDSAVLCFSCGGVHGDPFEGIRFDKNILSVFHYGGSGWKWSLTHKFQFRKGNWVLIGETSNYWWTLQRCDKLNDFAGTKYRDVNYLTGQYEEKEISDNCKLLQNKKGKQKIQPLVALENFTVFN